MNSALDTLIDILAEGLVREYLKELDEQANPPSESIPTPETIHGGRPHDRQGNLDDSQNPD